MTIGQFWEAVTTYCKENGGSITSGIRSSKRNRIVGGKENSPHLAGYGADVVYDIPLGTERVTRARDLGLFLYAEGDHDHLQPLAWNAREGRMTA